MVILLVMLRNGHSVWGEILNKKGNEEQDIIKEKHPQ